MPMTFMSGQETLKYTHPTTELTSISSDVTEIKNKLEEVSDKLDNEIFDRMSSENDIDLALREELNVLNGGMDYMNNLYTPIIHIFYVIVATRWFMLLNRFVPMVIYRTMGNELYVVPVQKYHTKKQIKEFRKRFKQDLTKSKYKVSELHVKFRDH